MSTPGVAGERLAGDTKPVSKSERIAEHALRQGDLDTAIEAAGEGLRHLGTCVPRNNVRLVFGVVWHLLMPSRLTSRRSPTKDEAALAVARLCHLLSSACIHAGQTGLGVWAHFCGLRLANRFTPTPEREQALTDHAWLMSLFALTRRLRTNVDSYWAQSVLHYADADFPACVEASRAPLLTLEAEEGTWEVTRCRYQLALAYFRLGRLPDAIAEAERVYHEGSAFAGEFGYASGLDVWALAAEGDIPHTILSRELERPCSNVCTMAQLLVAEGRWHLHRDEFAEAVDAFENACVVARRARVTITQVGLCEAWLATSLRQLAEQAESTERRVLLRQAGWAAKRALRRAKRFRADLPHALRECGLIAALQGNRDRAWRAFDTSIAVAREQHACYEYGKTLEARGEIGKGLGWEESGDDVADGRYLINELKSARSDPIITESNRVVRRPVAFGAKQRP